MKKLIIVPVMFLFIGCAVTKKINENDFKGIWQFPNRLVWVEPSFHCWILQIRNIELPCHIHLNYH